MVYSRREDPGRLFISLPKSDWCEETQLKSLKCLVFSVVTLPTTLVVHFYLDS